MLLIIAYLNPYALQLKIPRQCFKPLRTNQHYLQFIETVTWYHQAQRVKQYDKETGEEYIATTLEDIEITNRLMKETLLTKSDELPKAIRSFFESLKDWLKSENPTIAEGEMSFYSKALRNHFRMYPMKANRYIKVLEGFGLIKRKGGSKRLGYEYEISDWKEYEQLMAGVNVLDELLESLKRM